MSIQIEIPYETIVAFCKKWKIVRLDIFGSVLRDDFRPDSDVDMLVTFEQGVVWTFEQWLAMIRELETIFGRPVDLVERRQIEQSPNYIRRRHILAHLENVYVAG